MSSIIIPSPVALATTLFFSSASFAAPLYQITDLGAFGTYYFVGVHRNEISSFGEGVNDQGLVAGTSETVNMSTSGPQTRAFVSDADGSLINLGVLGGHLSAAQDVNNLGQVTGSSHTPFESNGVSELAHLLLTATAICKIWGRYWVLLTTLDSAEARGLMIWAK
jgi:probable HAF family extracellular repeat protein